MVSPMVDLLALAAGTKDANQVIGSLAELELTHWILLTACVLVILLPIWRSQKSCTSTSHNLPSPKTPVDDSPQDTLRKKDSQTSVGRQGSIESRLSSCPSSTSFCGQFSEKETMGHETCLLQPHMQGTVIGNDSAGFSLQEEVYTGPWSSMFWYVHPSGRVHQNPAKPFSFQNEFCHGHFLPLHRPTHNQALDTKGNYPYGDHFTGRKRLWELRIQFQVKEAVQGNMLLGIELENYVPQSSTTKKLMGLTLAALRQVVGNDLYHSIGDDPKEGEGPHEKPVFVVPTWAWDQFICTPADEEPPDLTDPAFATWGTKRSDDKKAFMKEMTDLKFIPGQIYTVSSYGISRFLDCINWKVKKIIPFKGIDFDQFCGKPPVTVVMYTLNPGEGGDVRHLQSRKKYYFRYALWSSKRPPTAEKLRELIPEEEDLAFKNKRKASDSESIFCRYLPRQLACCMSPRWQA